MDIMNIYWAIFFGVICLVIFFGALFWYIRRCWRQPRRGDYTVLEDEALLSDRLEMDRKLQQDADRNMAMIQCQYYLRDSGRYLYIRQLSEIGSRRDKHWFVVKDTKTKTERLLTMMLLVKNCPVRFNGATGPVLMELLRNLNHPYIYPILDIDRRIITEQEFVIAVIPFNETGTLKDLIHPRKGQDGWKQKSSANGCTSTCTLQLAQIQRLGCQILEALMFLKSQRFPPFVHLHSGNIIVQNGVARLSGLENVLLGCTSRYYLLVPKKVYDNKEVAEIISFGHLLFEMAAGHELKTSHPTEKDMSDLNHLRDVSEVLRFIFEKGHNQYPSLEEIASLDFFRYIDLRELQSHVPITIFRSNLSHEAKCLLKEIRRHQRPRKRSKRSQSMSTLDTTSIHSTDSASTTSSRRVKKKKKQGLTSSETTPDQLCIPVQLQTMPLSDIEGSCETRNSGCSNSTLETAGPQPITGRPPNKRGSINPTLLREIKSGFKLKHVPIERNPRI